MARRSNISIKCTPNYGLIGKPDLFTIKMYYNGRFKSLEKHNEYICGSFEYFDYVDLDKLGMIEMWGFMEELGFEDKESFRFWHKVGSTISEGIYLVNDSDVLNLRKCIPINYEVEVYIEHLDARNDEVDNANVENLDNSEYDFLENDCLFDAFVVNDIESMKEQMIVRERENTDDLLHKMHEDDSEADICIDSDGLNSFHGSDEDEGKKYPFFDTEKDFENPDLKLGLVFSSKKEAKFTIESQCIREERPVKFVKNDNIRLWAKCNDDNCCWKIHVAKMTNDNCWQVRNFDGCHSHCVRDLFKDQRCADKDLCGGY